MDIAVIAGVSGEHSTPLLVVPLFEGEREPGEDGGIEGAVRRSINSVIERGDFKGRDGQTLLLYPPEGSAGAERILLVGTGKREKFEPEKLRRAAGTAVREAQRLGVERFATALHRLDPGLSPEAGAHAVAEGLELASYAFDELRSADPEKPARRVQRVELLETDSGAEVERGIRTGAAYGRAANLARRLGNLPGNIATPDYLAGQAREIAERTGQAVRILDRAELEAEGFGALLAVARGTDEEPRLIILEHLRGADGARPLVLVGKGLTFDSGGISIKPAQGMEEMKFDMCGGAAVLAAMQGIGELEIPINVVGIVPASENLLSGKAMKPGDIVRSHLGKTIEIINTDAEGRLILADALSYARRYDPAAIVDVATLTGACVIALGTHASGAMTNDDALLAELRVAGDRVFERIWPLPMHEEYREQIKSDYADIKNSGGRSAGTITAAWFLREFVGDTPWVHLDIAGTANGDGKLPYQVKGATGVPARLLIEWVRTRAG